MRGLRIHETDNVAVVLEDVPRGESVAVSGMEVRITALDPVPIYHKIALSEIPKDAPVIKYGEVIGLAAEDIPRGSHIHEHNVKSILTTDN